VISSPVIPSVELTVIRYTTERSLEIIDEYEPREEDDQEDLDDIDMDDVYFGDE
jgi:hypothetical protein